MRIVSKHIKIILNLEGSTFCNFHFLRSNPQILMVWVSTKDNYRYHVLSTIIEYLLTYIIIQYIFLKDKFPKLSTNMSLETNISLIKMISLIFLLILF